MGEEVLRKRLSGTRGKGPGPVRPQEGQTRHKEDWRGTLPDPDTPGGDVEVIGVTPSRVSAWGSSHHTCLGVVTSSGSPSRPPDSGPRVYDRGPGLRTRKGGETLKDQEKVGRWVR